MPDDAEWQQLGELLESHPAKLMIWEGPPQADIVAQLDSRGITCVTVSACGNVPASGDYLEAMRKNVDSLKSACQSVPSP